VSPPDARSGASLLGDGDGDYPGSGRYDRDDAALLRSGRAPSAVDAHAIARLVTRYYAAAAAGDGARACALAYYRLAETIPEKYARPPGPLYLRGATTCQAVLSRVFARFHKELATLPTIGPIRVRGSHADVLLGWPALPAGVIGVRREGRGWKLNGALAVGMP
jgi:hypothetical protein